MVRVGVVLFLAALPTGVMGSDSVVSIVAGAETHGMIVPCDCPAGPGGGLAKRASAVTELRAGHDIVLVDAGGFCGGGFYDNYTRGREGDSIRTRAVVEAMGMMGYDAAAVGDEELQYPIAWLTRIAAEAGVPLVSANLRLPDGSRAVPGYVVVCRRGVDVAITGVTTTESRVEHAFDVRLAAPFEALRQLWPAIQDTADVTVILSHLGEELSYRLIDSFPACDVVVNGHRKTGTAVSAMHDGTLLLQFGFQGKTLSRADVRAGGDSVEVLRTSLVEIGLDRPDDRVVAEMIGEVEKDLEALEADVRMDLSIMSMCPYGLSALGELLKLTSEMPRIDWHVWFIGSVSEDSTLHSLHGPEEVGDEMVWLAVKELRPELWRDFLRARVLDSLDTHRALEQVEIEPGELREWISGEGRARLRAHYARSTRLGVTSSPTFHIDNVVFEEPPSLPYLARAVCAAAGGEDALCDSLPECLDDRDCGAAGKIGRCVGEDVWSGKCEFENAVSFAVTVVHAESTLTHPEMEVIRWVRELFPGADIGKYAPDSPEGTSLLEEFGVTGVPFYVFGNEIGSAVNFEEIQPRLTARNGRFVFKDESVVVNYFPQRPARPGSLTVLIDPVFNHVADALEVAGEIGRGCTGLEVAPMIYRDPRLQSESTEELVRREEAQRWCTIRRLFPGKYDAYLAAYRLRPGSSYWVETVTRAGINEKRFRSRLRKSGQKELIRHFESIDELDPGVPVALLKDNREVVPLTNPRRMRSVLTELCTEKTHGAAAPAGNHDRSTKGGETAKTR